MNDYQTRFVERALNLYDSRRELGTPEGRALFSTASGLAEVMNVTRERARVLLVDALKKRTQTGTRTDMGVF